jgi:hypothetical protein
VRWLPWVIAVIALVLNAEPASGRSLAPGATCKAGLKPAVVGGVFSCLKVGQTCQAKHERDYARSGFACRSGRLRTSPSGLATARSPSAPGSSRENPVLLGKPGALGNGWTVTITNVNPDATAAILGADPANSPPLNGLQYVLVTISAIYEGAGSSHLTPGTSLHSIGASNVAHSTANSFCGKLPSPNLDLDNPLVFKGGTISGYAACWMVAAGDVSSLEMYYQPLLSTTPVWFALH